MSRQKIIAIIPARYESTRFPGKLLVPLGDKTILQRTYENALCCHSLDKVYIATDDSRIYDHADEIGAPAVMTSLSCLNGTERIAEAIASMSDDYSDDDIIINLQGDEPCVEPESMARIVTILQDDPSAVMSTAAAVITDTHEIDAPGVVKCVFDAAGKALMFSRSRLPYHNDTATTPLYYRHIGIYGFRKHFLLTYASLPPTPLQTIESLEQLKVLEHGYDIHVAIVKDDSIGVNTPEDLSKLAHNMALSE